MELFNGELRNKIDERAGLCGTILGASTVDTEAMGRPHWGIVGPTELLYRVTEQCHHFHPNLVRGYLDIFGEGMEK